MHIVVSDLMSKQWKLELIKINIKNQIITNDALNLSAQLAKKYLSLSTLSDEIKYGAGFLELYNVPIDSDIYSPPSNAERPYAKGYISELVLLGITKALGFHPFSYLEEKQGVFIHEITPTHYDNNQKISSEGIQEFDFHTDGAYLDRYIRPHILVLLCLIDELNTDTKLIKVDDIIQKISDKNKAILSEARFIHLAPETFKVKHNANRSSVIDLVNGYYEMKMAFHQIQPIDDDAKIALQELKKSWIVILL